jgi:hypothetical protein
LKQININFEAVPVEAYETCREYVQSLTHQQGRPQKAIAADMDYSPSDLTRKLAQSPDDSRRFTLDDLENWVQVTGDLRPLHFLLQKHSSKARSKEQIQAEIEELKKELEK